MTGPYAEVIVDISADKLDHPFTYRVPEHLRENIVPGSSVKIPFGKGGREITGYVVKLTDQSGIPDGKIKEILEVETGEETVEKRMVSLAAWMSRTYGSTMIQALKTVVPVRRQVRIRPDRIVSLKNPELLEAQISICEKKHWTARKRVLECLKDGPAKWEDVLKEAKTAASVLNEMEQAGYLLVERSDTISRLVRETSKEQPDVLTDEQQRAVNEIVGEWNGNNRPVLINGITGSGKTAVYTELAAKILAEGKQVIILIPEISLTRQTVKRFVRRFGDQVSFLHSRLSSGERYDQMKAARAGKVRVMVGPRSALFTPFPQLGLIVMDEEHEESYHSETSPRYSARDVAIRRGETEGAHVVLGSATPSVSSAYRAKNGQYFGVTLKKRYGGAVLPDTVITDMREELRAGNRSVLGTRLKEEIAGCLSRGEQALLFLNRRGYTGQVTCRSCGHVMKCPHCDVALTKHKNGKLVCHYCGYETPDVRICPECGSSYIGGMTVGTEMVEDVVRRTFPGIRILRMDADTTRGKEGHSAILKSFGDHEADVLIGTQMIVKGHDFPDVTLVGVLLADLSLNADDYRAAERTYQLVTQAVGRAGRGAKKGLAVIQTYQPEHYALTAAARQDYDAFYREEILFRSLMHYPPCGAMEAILGSSGDEKLLHTGMLYIRAFLGRIDPGNTLCAIGPAPLSIRKVKDIFREVIYIRSEDREHLIRAKDQVTKYVEINSGFDNISVQFDLQI